jgi:hypothetical protein
LTNKSEKGGVIFKGTSSVGEICGEGMGASEGVGRTVEVEVGFIEGGELSMVADAGAISLVCVSSIYIVFPN